MTTTAEPAGTYSTDDEIRNVLGALRDRLPSWVDVGSFRVTAHAETVDLLARAYPARIPELAGPGRTVAALAEARLAAASILDAIRVNLPDAIADQPADLRASATASLIDGVPGYPPGSVGTVPGDGDGSSGGTPYGTGPRVSSFTPASAFPDPYAELRDLDDAGRWL